MKTREQYLVQRPGGGWAFRIAIPEDVQGSFRSSTGKVLHHVVKGLHTSNMREAKAQRDELVVKWNAAFSRARTGVSLTVAEINQIALDAYHASLRFMERSAAQGMAPEAHLQEWPDGRATTAAERQVLALDVAVENAETALEERNWASVAGDIKAIEKRTGVPLDPANDTYQQLAEALLRADIAAMQGRIRGLQGEPSEDPVSLVPGGIDLATLKPVRAWPTPQTANGNGLAFSEIRRLHLADQTRDAGAMLRPATLRTQERICQLFQDHIHDAPINSVTREMAADFLSTLGTERHLSNRSLNQMATSLSGVFRWAKKVGKLQGENPFSDQQRPVASNGWLPYNDQELATLFSGGLFERPITSPLRWCMVISLYGGLRINECAGLMVRDLRKQEGVWVFDVHESDGHKLKTASAQRFVPIHSTLIRAGLLEYAHSLPADGQLFPSLTPNRDGKRGWHVTEAFTAHRRACKITRDRLSFHSLRKNFTTACDQAAIPEADIKMLLGHARGFTLATYSAGPGLQRLLDAVERISYPTVHI